jgi:anti-sigma-K factor RskA
MSPDQLQSIDRATELLAEEALYGLDTQHTRELDELLQETGDSQHDGMMEVAALLQLGFLKTDPAGYEPMPEHLRNAVSSQAQEFFTKEDQPDTASSSASVSELADARQKRESRRASSRWLRPGAVGWYLAATLALAFVVYRTDTAVAPAPTPSVTEQRQALLADTDTMIIPWATSDQAGYTSVTGDVVWNNSQQAGFMRLAGMPSNKVSELQYQLWIVDPTRDSKPVDGGVFDIPAGADEVIVPIDAKLAIVTPQAFAITAEQPGGVVVSAGPLLVVAPVSG